MPATDLTTVALIIGASVLAAAVVLLGIALLPSVRRKREETRAAPDHTAEDTHIALLMREGVLVDMTPPAAELFAPRFPGFPGRPPRHETLWLPAGESGDDAQLELAGEGDTVRIRVEEPYAPSAADLHQKALSRISEERARQAIAHAPFPAWETDLDGAIVSTNAAYRQLAEEARENGPGLLATGLPLPRKESPVVARVEVQMRDDRTESRWFDVTILRVGDVFLHYATDTSPVIRAEVAQRNFVQTLTKTFALLSIGLAIFDRNRRLTLFNPALIDMTGLPPELLSERPTLASFFDALRDRQVMPEPKNYAGWRETVSDLDTRAASGEFQDTWSLASGHTYRVTGRPYPNGAVAFLFEDISAEISASRRYHEYMTMAQSVMDSVEEAIAIFSAQGRMTMCNAAYRELWNVDEAGLTEVTVRDATKTWHEATEANPIWGDVRDFVGAFGQRTEWTADARLVDGRDLHCRFAPLAGGATLAGFRLAERSAARHEERTG